MFTKKMKGLLLVGVFALVTAGCSTVDHSGEGMSAGVLAGAAAGYLITGGSPEGTAVGAAVGGLAGNLAGRAFKKRYGYEEQQLSLYEKRNYVKREAMNGYLQCVENFSQMYGLSQAQQMCWEGYLKNAGIPRPMS